MEQKSIKNKTHYVYDGLKEFLEHNPGTNVVFDWRKANEGDWVLSDDDRIVQLLKVSKDVKHPGDRKNYKYANGWVRTVVGSFLNRPNVKMDTDFSSHPNRYTFSKKIKNTNKRVVERKKVTKKEREFATNIVVGMGAVEAYKNAYTELSDNKARKKATVLLKQELSLIHISEPTRPY